MKFILIRVQYYSSIQFHQRIHVDCFTPILDPLWCMLYKLIVGWQCTTLAQSNKNIQSFMLIENKKTEKKIKNKISHFRNIHHMSTPLNKKHASVLYKAQALLGKAKRRMSCPICFFKTLHVSLIWSWDGGWRESAVPVIHAGIFPSKHLLLHEGLCKWAWQEVGQELTS